MRTHYDAESDALYVRFAEGRIEGSQEVAPGIVLDFDDEHRLLGLEVLDASKRMAAGTLPVAAE